MYKSNFVLAISVATLFSVGPTNPAMAAGIDEVQPGHWYEVPNSRLDSVDPCPAGNCSYSGNLGVSAVMDAWSGGVFDTRRNRLVVWGGGHASYAGNELYAFDVETERWSRLTEPTANIQQNVARYSDGRPSSRHTYSDIQYDPQRDWLVSMNAVGVYNPVGSDYATVDVFDFSSGTWIPKARRPGVGGDGAGSFSAYDPVSGRHFIHLGNGGRLQRYDPQADQWSNHIETGGVPIYMVADVDPTRNQLVAVGLGNIFVYDLGISLSTFHVLLSFV